MGLVIIQFFSYRCFSCVWYEFKDFVKGKHKTQEEELNWVFFFLWNFENFSKSFLKDKFLKQVLADGWKQKNKGLNPFSQENKLNTIHPSLVTQIVNKKLVKYTIVYIGSLLRNLCLVLDTEPRFSLWTDGYTLTVLHNPSILS